MNKLFEDRRKDSKQSGDKVEAPTVQSKFYLRESTSEWVLEIQVSIPGEIESVTRFTGKSPLEAYNDFDKWTNRN